MEMCPETSQCQVGDVPNCRRGVRAHQPQKVVAKAFILEAHDDVHSLWEQVVGTAGPILDALAAVGPNRLQGSSDEFDGLFDRLTQVWSHRERVRQSGGYRYGLTGFELVGEKGQVSRASHLNTGRAGPSASTKAARRLDEYWSSGLTLAVLVTPTMEVSEPRDLLDVRVRRQRWHLRVCQGHAGAW